MIQGLSGSLAIVSHMEVIILSRYILASSLSDIYLHTSMINFLGFVLISWASSFSRFWREGRYLARLLLEEVNVESINALVSILLEFTLY